MHENNYALKGKYNFKFDTTDASNIYWSMTNNTMCRIAHVFYLSSISDKYLWIDSLTWLALEFTNAACARTVTKTCGENLTSEPGSRNWKN